MNEHPVLRSLIVGATAGIVGAWIMKRFQSVLEAADLRPTRRGKPSTVKAANRAAETLTDSPLPKRKEPAGGVAVHYAFGAFLGAVYGVAGRRFPVIRARFGTAYGAAVALLADELAVPLTGLGPTPDKTSPALHVYGVASHLIFGAGLEAASRMISRAGRTGSK